MSIAHPFFLGQYWPVSTPAGSMLRVSQAGVTPIPIASNVRSNSSPPYKSMTKQGFVWDGSPFFPTPLGDLINNGWLVFNPGKGAFTNEFGFSPAQNRIVPVGEYAAHFRSSEVSRGPNPRYCDSPPVSVATVSPDDFVVLDQDIYLLSFTGQDAVRWGYPFSTGPSVQINVPLSRLAVFKGKVYGVQITTTTSWLWEHNGVSWVQVGSGFAVTDAANVLDEPTQVSLFEWEDQLWLLCTYGIAGSWQVRAYVVDTSLGTVAEDTSIIPVAYKGGGQNGQRIFEVIDDLGTARKVTIVRCGDEATGSWEASEFIDTAPWVKDSGGGQIIFPYCGVLWDINGAGAQIQSAFDSSPSSYVTMGIRVADPNLNAPANIDPRYRRVSDVLTGPPFNVCTKKTGVGSSGKTNLATAPIGFVSPSDLGDNFSDGIIDPNKWEPVNPTSFVDSLGRDLGFLYNGLPFYAMQESIALGGQLVFGDLGVTEHVDAGTGVGLLSKWQVSGLFDARIRVANLANLLVETGRRVWFGMIVRTASRQAYCVRVFRSAAGPAGLFARAAGIDFGGSWAESADSITNVADGMELSIARDVLNVWTITLDPGGANEVLVPPFATPFADPVQFILLAMTEVSPFKFLSANPGPAIDNFSVAGAGALTPYRGGVVHNFMWDHVGDLGAGISDGVELFVDTE